MPGKHAYLRLPVSLVGVGAVFYGIKVLMFAEGNMTTALALALNIEFLPALGAMLLSVAPTVILPLALYAMRLAHKYYSGDIEGIVVYTLMYAVTGIALVFSSLLTLSICFGFAVLHLLYLQSVKKKWRRNFSWMRFRFEKAQPVIMALASTSLFTSAGWIPMESVTMQGSQHAVFIIRETGSEIIYLDMPSRQVVRTDAADISDRKFCGNGPAETVASMGVRMAQGPTYDACPKANK
ncbi:hypothetical protein JTF08_03270 [Micrococcaceae bacterium RIT802]|nr:hypothetical protein [Micrococcaceae bacterium RIT 802]